VEYLGRVDDQVKLRGLRIELGEIEAVLREQPGVTAAAVAVKESTPGDRRLIGYVTGEPPETAALRTALGARLPDYMVPSSFVVIGALPLSPNGKLDRKALPMPDQTGEASQAEHAEPRTDLERAIAEIWCQVLRRDRVGVDDDFFTVGGHSLLATQVVAKLRPVIAEHGGRSLGVMDLFQNKTIRSMAAFIGEQEDAGPRGLLYEMTKPILKDQRVCTYVCVPYGGGSAAVYRAIADQLPAGHTLLSVAIPGHDVGLDEEPLPFHELARRCCAEVLDKATGPLVLYGHCGVGGALIVELARQLEAAGREIDAVYVGGIFPFAKPRGLLSRFQSWTEDVGSNRAQVNWLKSMGVAMDEIDPEHADRIISNMRQDGKSAEAHFTELLEADPVRLKAPIISVVGERDPITDFYRERYREWQFLTDKVAVVVLDEAGHFFLRYRASELADIITRTHKELQTCRTGIPDESVEGDRPTWWVEGVTLRRDAGKPGTGTGGDAAAGMRRFLAVASGQLVSAVGSGLTGFAIPVWILQKTGSLGWFGLTGVLAVVPMLLLMPAAGAVADRADRRRVLMAAGAAAGGVELGLAALMSSGHNSLWAVYAAMMLIICAGTFQRVTFIAAIPQLAPKQFLGHANGIAQAINGAGLLFAPLLAAGLYAVIGLQGILIIDIVSYAFALSVLGVVKFPDLLGRRRRETFWTQVLGGAQLSWQVPQFRAMLAFFGIGNLLYAAPILLVTPLVLSFAHLAQVGTAAVAEGLGALAGGALLTVWGGPGRGRMRVIMRFIAVSGGFVALTGLRPDVPVVVVGVFGTALALGLANGIYFTIIQVKIPQRFHGRVIALNQSIAWATIPLGFALFVPLSGPVLNPLLRPHGALAGTVGQVLGTGEGRGLGLAYVFFGVLMALNALIGLRLPVLRDLDEQVPDADPDDLIGQRALEERSARVPVLAQAVVPKSEEAGA
jgi:surfactin synthase thioesterase subunit